MLRKHYSKTGRVCRVTFGYTPEVPVDSVSLCGEFNGWDPDAHPMKRLKDGSFSTTLSLDAGQSYRFKYLLDGRKWENDWAADSYQSNDMGTDDSVVNI